MDTVNDQFEPIQPEPTKIIKPKVIIKKNWIWMSIVTLVILSGMIMSFISYSQKAEYNKSKTFLMQFFKDEEAVVATLKYTKHVGIDWLEFVSFVIAPESNFKKYAKGTSGETSYTQMLPSVRRTIKNRLEQYLGKDKCGPYDTEFVIWGGALHIKGMLDKLNNNWYDACVAYNVGLYGFQSMKKRNYIHLQKGIDNYTFFKTEWNNFGKKNKK